MQSNTMERRLNCFEESTSLTIAQKRKGLIKECLGCEQKTEFKWYDTTNGMNTKIGSSKERSGCCIRFLCAGNQAFKMDFETEDNEKILSMERPLKCFLGPCKCCCYQEMSFYTDKNKIGSIHEKFFCCVPRFMIKDSNEVDLYKVHSPTCCGGCCVNCCAEGNPCGGACCVVPFHIFPASQDNTDNGADHIGKIVKRPKSLAAELFTDADMWDIKFPDGANVVQKALLAGSTTLLNAIMDTNSEQ